MLAALLLAALTLPGADVEVQSATGLFHARLAKAVGQERVADVLARWKLEVRDDEGRVLWTAFHPAPTEQQRYYLADDASVFAVIEPHWSDARAVVRLQGPEGEAAKVYGGELNIAREHLRGARPEGTWLADSAEPVRFAWIMGPYGPRQVLELDCVDGETREIDLESGRPMGAGGGLVRVWVDPPFEKDSVPPSAVPYVLEYSAPETVAGDEALVVRLSGSHPNPGWRIFAFSLESGADGRTLVLTPRARPPLPPGVTIQALEPFTATAHIHGLPPGDVRLMVVGHEGPAGPALSVRVEPGGVLARLHTRGGILGLEETLTVYVNGVVELSSNRAEGARSFVAPRAFAEARARLQRLPGISPGASSAGADFMHYQLTWRVGGQWRTVEADDGTARGELREAVDAVRALAPR